jgi:hypothetical protein
MHVSTTLSPSVLAALNAMLVAGVQVPDRGTTDVLHTATLDFGKGLQADIKLVNSEGGPYIDPVLFFNGSECGLLEPRFTRFEGSYEFTLDGEIYTAVVQ